MGKETLVEFPCDFPIKILGHNSDAFKTAVGDIVKKHFPEIQNVTEQTRASRDGSYLAITITVHAHSKAELDALYIDLTSCEYVVFAL